MVLEDKQALEQISDIILEEEVSLDTLLDSSNLVTCNPYKHVFYDFRHLPLEDLQAFKVSAKYDVLRFGVFILSVLRFFSNCRKKGQEDMEDWCFLSSSFYNKLCGINCFSRTMKLLEALGYIHIDRRYQVGRYSMCYRLSKKFKEKEWQIANFDAFTKEFCGLKRKFCDIWESFCQHLKKWEKLPKGQKMKTVADAALAKCADLELIQDEDTPKERRLAAEARFKKLEAEIQTQNERIIKRNAIREAKGWKPIPLKMPNVTIEDIEKIYQDCLDSFGDPSKNYIKFDSATGRMFALWVNLKSIWRKNLRSRGKKLFNVDIRCAQPCLLSCLYEDSEKDSAEKEKFIKFVRENDFYQTMADQSPKETKLSRDDAKIQTFVLMFARNRTMVREPIYKIFKKMFPVLASRIYGIKKVNYKDVAKKMQTTEADIMIYGVLPEADSRGIRVYPIHDSMLCAEEDIPAVQEMIIRHFESVTGFKPVLKV